MAMLAAVAAPASAQWSRVGEVDDAPIPTVVAKGDTIVAGADSVVYISTSAGKSWTRSSTVTPGATSIQSLWIENGRIYAGTYGQGVHVTDDLGASWQPFNEGLVGGFLDSQLFVVDLVARGDQLFAATAGAGVYVRSLLGANAWQPFGTVLEPEQASTVNGLGVGGARLLTCAGANGMVFFNDAGDPDWTISFLDNQGIHAGLTSQSAIWTGAGWVVGSNLGIFRSAVGAEPWTRFDPRLGSLTWTAFALSGGHLFGVFDTRLSSVLEGSADGGVTWQVEDVQSNVFVQKIAVSGSVLYAARGDGLWWRPIAVTAVESVPMPKHLGFAVVGPQPFGGSARLRFELPQSEAYSIEIFDAQGRLVGERRTGRLAQGTHELSLDSARLPSGVYLARLTAGEEHAVVRLVHVR